MAGENGFMVEITSEYKLKIELGGYEKIDTLDKLATGIQTMTKMGKWLEDKSVADADKDNAMPMFRNLLRTVSDLWLLLGWAGVSESEIRQHMQIPF
jgi:beta-phosphoglucomutase-like phosphatase (HAD superfamily)